MAIEEHSPTRYDAIAGPAQSPPAPISPLWGWLLGGGSLVTAVVTSLAVGSARTWEAGVATWWALAMLTPLVEYQLGRWDGSAHPRAYWLRRGIVCLSASGLGILSILTKNESLRLGLGFLATLVFASTHGATLFRTPGSRS